MAHLAKAIAGCPALHELSIAGNQIGSRGLCSVLGAVSDSKIEVLNLSENRIDATGAALVASFLALKNQSIKDLDLSQNPLTDQGAAEVLSALCSGQIQMQTKKAKKEDAKPAQKKDQKKTELVLGEVEREEEPEFDSVEKYITYHWNVALQTFKDQYGLADDWLTVPPQGAPTLVKTSLELCGLGVLSSCQMVKLLQTKPERLHLLIHNNDIPEIGFY